MYIGIDLGTSSVKLMAVDGEGHIKGECTKSYEVHYPKALWAEQNPLDWWEATITGLEELFLEIDRDQVKSIGFSGQMHGLVTLDENCEIIYPAILWCDQRTQNECDAITNHFSLSGLKEMVGNQALTGFTAPKLLWLKKHEPQLYKRIKHILLPKDYIRYQLTGDFATDYSDASGMLLLDVAKKDYNDDMLDFLDIKREQLPKLYESYEVTGKLSSDIKKRLNVQQDILIVGGAGDQAAGAIGSGIVSSGLVSVTLGTSGVVFAAHDEYKVDDEMRLHAFCHANGSYHTMGVMLSAASSLKWWTESCLETNDFDGLLDAVDSEITDIIFLPYLMGERTPYPNPNAKGVFFGLSMNTKQKDMTKAVLEGVAFGLKDSLDLLENMSIPVEEIRLLGGGAKSTIWKQIVADVFGKPVYDINTYQGGALGAAILAAVGAKAFASVESATQSWIKITNCYEPNLDKHLVYKKKHEKYTKLYQNLETLF